MCGCQEIRILSRRLWSPPEGSKHWYNFSRLKKAHCGVGVAYELVEEDKELRDSKGAHQKGGGSRESSVHVGGK